METCSLSRLGACNVKRLDVLLAKNRALTGKSAADTAFPPPVLEPLNQAASLRPVQTHAKLFQVLARRDVFGQSVNNC